MKNIFLVFCILGSLALLSCEQEEMLYPPTSNVQLQKAKISVRLFSHDEGGDCNDGESISFTEVYLYLSEEDRSNNNVYKQGKTGTDGSITFVQLDQGLYYVQASYEEQTIHDSIVISGNVRTAFVDLFFERDGGN